MKEGYLDDAETLGDPVEGNRCRELIIARRTYRNSSLQ